MPRRLYLPAAFLLALGAAAPPNPPATPANAPISQPASARWAALIQRLGSPDFAQREAAQNELARIPTDQFDMLCQLAARQGDEEVKVRLRTRINEMAGEIARHKPESPLRVEGHIRGRLVDETGKPIAGARAQAYLAAWGQELWGIPHWALTDAQGRFDVPVPFVEVNFHIFMEMTAWSTSYGKDILVEKNTSAGDFVMQRVTTKTMQGSLVDSAGKPVANQEVEIVGEHETGGGALTDAQGRFVIEGLPSYLGQCRCVTWGPATCGSCP